MASSVVTGSKLPPGLRSGSYRGSVFCGGAPLRSSASEAEYGSVARLRCRPARAAASVEVFGVVLRANTLLCRSLHPPGGGGASLGRRFTARKCNNFVRNYSLIAHKYSSLIIRAVSNWRCCITQFRLVGFKLTEGVERTCAAAFRDISETRIAERSAVVHR